MHVGLTRQPNGKSIEQALIRTQNVIYSNVQSESLHGDESDLMKFNKL